MNCILRFIALAEELIESAKELDSALHAELMADIKKELNLEVSSPNLRSHLIVHYTVQINRLKSTSKSRDLETARAYDEVLQRWMQQTQSTNGSTSSESIPFMPQSINALLNESFVAIAPGGIVRLPSALPVNILPLVLREPEINKVGARTTPLNLAEVIDICL
jgi:hypothetical protein